MAKWLTHCSIYMVLTLLVTAYKPLPVFAAVWVWDGELTTGKSGVEHNVDDERDSTTHANSANPNVGGIVWPLPIDRYFEDVDAEEAFDYRANRWFDNRHVSPYTVATLARPWFYRGQAMATGVYLVKLGAYNAGSLKTHRVWAPLPPNTPDPSLAKRLKGKAHVGQSGQLTLVLSIQGRVKAVLPVTQIQPLSRQQRKAWVRDTAVVTYTPLRIAPTAVTIRGKRFSYTAPLP
jgi:hypothetical protein